MVCHSIKLQFSAQTNTDISGSIRFLLITDQDMWHRNHLHGHWILGNCFAVINIIHMANRNKETRNA